MSKEKLYVVKNDKGYYWDFEHSGFWEQEIFGYLTTPSRKQAELVAFEKDGHVVTLIEEPKKVVLGKELAEIVENAHEEEFPATYISDHTGNSCCLENKMIEAYVNGYTVEKDKKYLVYKTLGGKQNKDSHTGYAQACRALSNSETMFWVLTKWIIYDKGAKFTEKEISDYGLQDCEKVECDNDEQ